MPLRRIIARVPGADKRAPAPSGLAAALGAVLCFPAPRRPAAGGAPVPTTRAHAGVMSEKKTLQWKLRRALAEPGVALSVAAALARGSWYRLSCRVRGIPMRAGRNFRVYGRIRFSGPGRVEFGDNVSVRMEVTPWTYDAGAVISIGDDSFVNGTAFGCQSAIRIGPRAILANANIMDTDFHSIHADRHEPGAPVRVAPVIVEENVWIAARAGVLPGTTIGRNSVVGFGAVCAGSYPANSVIVGNPARVVRAVPGAEPAPAGP